MMYQFNQMSWGVGPGMYSGIWGIAIVLMVWALFWKGFALWKAARRGDTIWFVILLLLNTVGIAEILYLYFFSEPKGLLKDTSNTVKGGEKKKSDSPKK